MAPVNNQNLNYSSNYGEAAAQKVNVLASCYLVDSAANLKGLHYCTTGVAGAECPPLAALTSSNELALLPKSKKREIPGRRLGRRGGAALSIREECERFFCESMKMIFHGERNSSMNGSGLSGAFLPTPPSDDRLPEHFKPVSDDKLPAYNVTAWLEMWDYAGGASFRAFVADDGEEKSLFVFFDIEGVLGRDLKKALMALIELADGPLDCAHVVTCIDRRIPADDVHSLTKSLQWVGFDMVTLDHWAHGLDVTSKKWMLMGMEL
ncbi:ornithine decarboxylase antizyme [Fusarium mexicanum]|uniref:Ornithine decarboxylase antizyme n=1 Tax=Fusarium mexicanum TaxID=751941 RepID=A0A8H5IHS7_9HYPO|nr:ornithine decarboxylase antizyme [Fusarium mexicanum]